VPFIWSEADGVAQLPITNARVFSINNDGVVAGVRRAEWPRVGVLVWLWSPADGLREIDDCEGANPFIRMNDDGEIVGMKGVGEPWPVVWRPVKQFGQ
jgi:hypothetical protein